MLLKDAEAATALLGAEKTTTIHLRDFILSKVSQKLRALGNTTQPGSIPYGLENLLKRDLLILRVSNLCDAAAVFSQVSTLLTPTYL